MASKIFLVTGGTSGVGNAIARGLAKTGATVIIVSRDSKNGQDAVNKITEVSGNKNIDFLVADLSLQSSIKRLSLEIKNKYSRLDGLINAAGALFFEKELTSEGIDKSFAVNYLSHFLLSNELIELFKESAPARILTVGGAPMYLKKPKIDLEDIQLNKGYSGMASVSQTMFARIYFAFELAERLQNSGVTSNVFHPGLISSNLVKNAPLWLRIMTSILRPWEKTECESGVYAATSPILENKNGIFINSDKKILPVNQAFDNTIGKKLWEKTISLVKQ